MLRREMRNELTWFESRVSERARCHGDAAIAALPLAQAERRPTWRLPSEDARPSNHQPNVAIAAVPEAQKSRTWRDDNSIANGGGRFNKATMAGHERGRVESIRRQSTANRSSESAPENNIVKIPTNRAG